MAPRKADFATIAPSLKVTAALVSTSDYLTRVLVDAELRPLWDTQIKNATLESPGILSVEMA